MRTFSPVISDVKTKKTNCEAIAIARTTGVLQEKKLWCLAK